MSEEYVEGTGGDQANTFLLWIDRKYGSIDALMNMWQFPYEPHDTVGREAGNPHIVPFFRTLFVEYVTLRGAMDLWRLDPPDVRREADFFEKVTRVLRHDYVPGFKLACQMVVESWQASVSVRN